MIMIRKATLDDLAELAELFDQYRVFYRKESDLAAAQEFLRERLSKAESEIFLAIEGGKAVGFVQCYPLFSSTRMKPLWLLNDLYVHPDFRGRGFSVKLIDRCKELCVETGACGLILETEKTNDIGQSLYPRAGFSVDEEHDFYSWDA